jgi:hypothetical protein
LAADPDFDVEVGLPAILTYQEGELVGNLIRFTEFISSTNGSDDEKLEQLLIQ